METNNLYFGSEMATMPDSDFVNHTWVGGAHAENHRYNDAYAAAKKACGNPKSTDKCSKLQTSLDCIKSKLDHLERTKGDGGRGAKRVNARGRKAYGNQKNRVQGWFNAGQCDKVVNVPVPGCMNDTATNFDRDATYDDGSCEFPTQIVYGCTDPNATNFDAAATHNDGTCTLPPPPPTVIYGCKNSNATNYDPSATRDDGSCVFPAPPPPTIPTIPSGSTSVGSSPISAIFGGGTTTDPETGAVVQAGGGNKMMMYAIGGVVIIGLAYMLFKK